jgi:DNA-binding NtrC family response regulator
MARILVIDDESSICWGVAQLGKRMGHEVDTAASAEQGLDAAARQTPDLILLDVRLPGMDGLAAIPHLRAKAPQSPIVVMTAHGDLSTAVEAVRQGAFDYVAKPFDLLQIERTVERALARPASTEVQDVDVQADGLVGRTSAMQEVFKRIALVAATDACVMLAGASGTGKELVARAIHRYSPRAAGPFVAVNVAALNPTLTESELFGHVRGAFTGADQPREGLLVQASGGTLFLDEVADIPLPVQVKLLRALEHGEVMPVGSGKMVRTRFRVITATHQDLPAMVRSREFRHDLYYRLATFQIDLPPLAARLDDLPLLAEYFVRQLVPEGRDVRISPAALEAMATRPWHGNVRELRHAIEHALILAREGVLLPEHLPPPLPLLEPAPSQRATESEAHAASPAAAAAEPNDTIPPLVRQWALERMRAGSTGLFDELLAIVEPPLLDAALRKHHGQCAAAARTLGMHRTTLRKKLDEYGIEAED